MTEGNNSEVENEATDLIDAIDSQLTDLQHPEPPPASDSLLQSLCMINTMLTQLNAKQQELEKQQRALERTRSELIPLETDLRNLERDLFARSDALDLQTQQIAESQAALEQRESKTSRQRRLIANQLRAQRAEQLLTAKKLDGEKEQALEQLRAQCDAELQQALAQRDVELEQTLAQREADLEQTFGQREAELEQTFAQREAELEQTFAQREAEQEQTLTQRVAELQQTLAQRDADQEKTLAQHEAELEQALAQRDAVLEQRFAERDSERDSARSQSDADLEQALATAQAERENARALESELDQLRQQLQALESERESTGSADVEEVATLQAAVDGLRCQRDSAQTERDAVQHEIDELKRQNRELASKLATQQVNVAGNEGMVSLESMSWEQRKSHMLQRLNAEDDELSDSEAAQQRLKIQDVIERTDREVSKRDAEIAELRCLLEQQSMAAGDMAIGGAAVLQMLDQDELILEERAKLQRIQGEWEEKLRQAEIDVSLERAKLARERIDIEQRLAEMREATKAEGKPESKGRKWLAQLGLTDAE
ncbi:coiled-coil domain-containing protein [Rosistilla carotiformis]|uniref:hypothetical protein n=1 Tax=Rosistilla carotiformis TaxID=2528017 RepID=UPI0011A7DDC4|nr:hypothetical protein [Rosistilla carotiformis]